MPTPDPFDSAYLTRRNAPGVAIHLHTLNPLDLAHAAPNHPFRAPQSSIVVIWSGWIGTPADSGDGHVEPDFRTWSAPGRQQLDAFLSVTLPQFSAAGARLWIRPHARHVLSDAPSCAALLRTHQAAASAGTLALLLDLDTLITPDMAARRVDHAQRIVATLAPLNAVAAVALPSTDWDGPLGTLVDAALPGAVHLARA